METHNPDYKQAKKLINTHRLAHTGCRASEKTKFDAKTTCRGEEEVLLTKKNNAKIRLESAEMELKGNVCGDPDATNYLKEKIATVGPYVAAGNAYITADAEHAKKVTECNGLDNDYIAKKSDCDMNQDDFEREMCGWVSKFKNWCSTYYAAHNVLKSDLESVWDGIQGRVSKRLFEWKHLKRVNCILTGLKVFDEFPDSPPSSIAEGIKTCN